MAEYLHILLGTSACLQWLCHSGERTVAHGPLVFIKAYIVGTHLNCINKLMAIQMSTHNICLYKEVDKKYTGCNLKTMELLDCVLIGICAVIRLNMV